MTFDHLFKISRIQTKLWLNYVEIRLKGATTFRIMTFSVMTLSMKGVFAGLVTFAWSDICANDISAKWQVRGKGSKLGEPDPKVRLSQDRLPIVICPHEKLGGGKALS